MWYIVHCWPQWAISPYSWPYVVPSPVDTRVGYVMCLGQWAFDRHDTAGLHKHLWVGVCAHGAQLPCSEEAQRSDRRPHRRELKCPRIEPKMNSQHTAGTSCHNMERSDPQQPLMAVTLWTPCEEKNHPMSPANPQNHKDLCCFKPLSLGMVCY